MDTSRSTWITVWFNQPTRNSQAQEKNCKARDVCEDFPPTNCWSSSSCCPWSDTQIQHESYDWQRIFPPGCRQCIPKKLASTIGIVVDHCCMNRSLEKLQAIGQRLKTCKAKLVVFPRHTRKIKVGDSAPEELATATQVHGAYMSVALSVDLVKVTEKMKSFNV